MPYTTTEKFDLAKYIENPELYEVLLAEMDARSIQFARRTTSNISEHKLAMTVTQSVLQHTLTDLVSQLTDIPEQYITYTEAWSYLIGQLKAPKNNDTVLSKQHITANNSHLLLSQNVPVEPQYYFYVHPDLGKANKALLREMETRRQFRDAIHTICSGKPYNKPLDFSQMLSPKCVALSADVVQIVSQYNALYPIHLQGSTDVDIEKTSDRLQKQKEDIKTFLEGIVKPDLKDKIMAIWNMSPLRNYRVPPSQRLGFARTLKPSLSTKELSALITHMNGNACEQKHIITDEMAASYISQDSVTNSCLYERIYAYLEPTNEAFFSNYETLLDGDITTHPVFKDLFVSVENSIKLLPDDYPESFQLDQDDPNYDLLSTLYKNRVTNKLDKTELLTKINSSLIKMLKEHVMPQLLEYRASWESRAKRIKRSYENYDFAHWLAIYTATNLSRIAMDTDTRQNLYGSNDHRFIYRPESNSSIPVYLYEFLHERLKVIHDDKERARLEATILKVHQIMDYVMLSHAGRKNVAKLRLHLPIDPKTGNFFPDKGEEYSSRYINQTPVSAVFAALPEHLWRRATTEAVSEFSVIPIEESPVSFESSPRYVGALALAEFLTKSSVATPVHVSEKEFETETSFHDLSMKVSNKTFFDNRGSGFYAELSKAYKIEAEALVSSTLDKHRNESDRNWLTYALNTFPAEAVMKALQLVGNAYKNSHKNTPIYMREEISPFTAELSEMIARQDPIIRVLMSPAASSFTASRDSTEYWSRDDENREFYRTVQDVIFRVRERMSKYLSLDTDVLLPINMLIPLGLEHFGNKNIGFISALCAPLYVYVIGALAKQSFDPSIKPRPIMTNMLRALFHKPNLVFEARIYKGIYPQIYKLYSTRVKEQVEMIYSRSSNPAYLVSRIMQEMDILDLMASLIPYPTQQGTPIKVSNGDPAALSPIFRFVSAYLPSIVGSPSRGSKKVLTAESLEKMLTPQAPMDTTRSIDPFNLSSPPKFKLDA